MNQRGRSVELHSCFLVHFLQYLEGAENGPKCGAYPVPHAVHSMEINFLFQHPCGTDVNVGYFFLTLMRHSHCIKSSLTLPIMRFPARLITKMLPHSVEAGFESEVLSYLLQD